MNAALAAVETLSFLPTTLSVISWGGLALLSRKVYGFRTVAWGMTGVVTALALIDICYYIYGLYDFVVYSTLRKGIARWIIAVIPFAGVWDLRRAIRVGGSSGA